MTQESDLTCSTETNQKQPAEPKKPGKGEREEPEPGARIRELGGRALCRALRERRSLYDLSSGSPGSDPHKSRSTEPISPHPSS